MRIFIASDDKTFTRVASFLLRRRGFAVVEGAGFLSLACLPEAEVDAVLVDGTGAEAAVAASLVHEWHPAAEAVVLGSDDVIWFPYVMIGWGIGVLIHYLSIARWSPNDVRRHQHSVEKFAQRDAGMND